MKRDHLVPLPTQAIELITELQKRTGVSRYLFPSSGEKVPVISDGSINKCFALIGYKGRMTGHGSRHTCDTLLSDHGWPEDWRDMHLAHKKQGLKGVYDKAVFLPQRQRMVQRYADYLGALEAGSLAERMNEFQNRMEGSSKFSKEKKSLIAEKPVQM